MLSGAFWINKPSELTSSDVVVRLKIALTRGGYCEKGFKIGHGGTLDPFATGAMIVLVGEATKLADAYLHSVKSYSGIITLGIQTDTGDLTGNITKRCPTIFGDAAWQKLANTFVSEKYWQTPPMYSAKKQQGRALYELARQGIEVERKSILKKIELFEVKPFQEPELSFQVRCESGTYVRVLAEDLAVKAGTVAHLRTLVRTQTSDVTLERCVDLDQVQSQLAQTIPIEQIRAFHPMQEVATHLPSIEVSEVEAQELLQGYKNTTQELIQRFQAAQSTSRARSEASAKYFVARLQSGQPVALFERVDSSTVTTYYRLQRVILWRS